MYSESKSTIALWNASIDAEAAVLIREEGKVDARYSVAEGVLALAEQKGPDRVIGSTIDEVLQALVHKHAHADRKRGK